MLNKILIHGFCAILSLIKHLGNLKTTLISDSIIFILWKELSFLLISKILLIALGLEMSGNHKEGLKLH